MATCVKDIQLTSQAHHRLFGYAVDLSMPTRQTRYHIPESFDRYSVDIRDVTIEFAQQFIVTDGSGQLPVGRKVRNSCVSGHYPGQPCHWCALAELCTVTTGDYFTTPNFFVLGELVNKNSLHDLVFGNMWFTEFLLDVAEGKVNYIQTNPRSPEDPWSIFEEIKVLHPHTLERRSDLPPGANAVPPPPVKITLTQTGKSILWPTDIKWAEGTQPNQDQCWTKYELPFGGIALDSPKAFGLAEAEPDLFVTKPSWHSKLLVKLRRFGFKGKNK